MKLQSQDFVSNYLLHSFYYHKIIPKCECKVWKLKCKVVTCCNVTPITTAKPIENSSQSTNNGLDRKCYTYCAPTNQLFATVEIIKPKNKANKWVCIMMFSWDSNQSEAATTCDKEKQNQPYIWMRVFSSFLLVFRLKKERNRWRHWHLTSPVNAAYVNAHALYLSTEMKWFVYQNDFRLHAIIAYAVTFIT